MPEDARGVPLPRFYTERRQDQLIRDMAELLRGEYQAARYAKDWGLADYLRAECALIGVRLWSEKVDGEEKTFVQIEGGFKLRPWDT